MDRVPPGRGRLAREPVSRHVGDHQVEGVRGITSMRGRVGEQVDDLHLLDERARPSVADDERQRVLVLGANVDEWMSSPSISATNCGNGVQPRLALAPVVLVVPVARDRLDRRQLHALRRIVDALLLRPRVAAMRARRSARSFSGTSIVNGRIATASADLSVVTVMWLLTLVVMAQTV